MTRTGCAQGPSTVHLAFRIIGRYPESPLCTVAWTRWRRPRAGPGHQPVRLNETARTGTGWQDAGRSFSRSHRGDQLRGLRTGRKGDSSGPSIRSAASDCPCKSRETLKKPSVNPNFRFASGHKPVRPRPPKPDLLVSRCRSRASASAMHSWRRSRSSTGRSSSEQASPFLFPTVFVTYPSHYCSDERWPRVNMSDSGRGRADVRPRLPASAKASSSAPVTAPGSRHGPRENASAGAADRLRRDKERKCVRDRTVRVSGRA